MRHDITRRQAMSGIGGLALSRFAPLRADTPKKPLRGIFPIMATPFTETKAVDYEDLAREVDFQARCGVHGMVWPQLASEYMTLSREERFQGMETIAKAAQGKAPALVLGVQGANVEKALEYLKVAEELAPDALIAIPPTEAKTIDDFRRYYVALAEAARRPLFIQTTGGAKGITPSVEMIVALAKEFPNLGFVKEEAEPVVERMIGLARARPAVKAVFSGAAGKAMMYEMRLGMDGTMPGAPYSDIYVQIWESYQAGNTERALEIFARLMVMINLDTVIPGTRLYMMKRRGVFKTTVSRRQQFQPTPKAVEEIEYAWSGLKEFVRA